MNRRQKDSAPLAPPTAAVDHAWREDLGEMLFFYLLLLIVAIFIEAIIKEPRGWSHLAGVFSAGASLVARTNTLVHLLAAGTAGILKYILPLVLGGHAALTALRRRAIGPGIVAAVYAGLVALNWWIWPLMVALKG